MMLMLSRQGVGCYPAFCSLSIQVVIEMDSVKHVCVCVYLCTACDLLNSGAAQSTAATVQGPAGNGDLDEVFCEALSPSDHPGRLRSGYDQSPC